MLEYKCALSGPDPPPSPLSVSVGDRERGWQRGAVGSPPCEVLREKTKAQRGPLFSPESHDRPSEDLGTRGRGCVLPRAQPLRTSPLQIWKGRRKRAARRASLRQVALLKLGLVANLTSFPWKQPVGQLVPVNLRPGGASAPDRLQELASSLRGGGTQEPRWRPPPTHFLPQEFGLKGKPGNCSCQPPLSPGLAQGGLGHGTGDVVGYPCEPCLCASSPEHLQGENGRNM